MICKFKNPYFDTDKDQKFVNILNSVLIDKSIYLEDGFVGLFINDNIIGVLNSQLDYKMAIYREVSVYEAFKDCIPSGKKYNKELDKLVPDITPADEFSQGLKDILDSSMNYGDKIRAIRSATSEAEGNEKHTGGDGNKWYDLPENANQLQDLIEHKNMNGNIKDCFKACYRIGEKEGTEDIYDIEKIAYYSLRELGRLKKTKDYVSLAEAIMGKQNIKGKKC